MKIWSRRARMGVTAAAVVALWTLAAGVAVAQFAYDSSFDHFSTGWPLEGAHQHLECATCHVGALFAGTPRQCVACHSRAGLVKATAAPLDHIRTTEECDACHRQTSWTYVRPIDHNAVIGTCISCHNGQTATGKGPSHIPTSSDCAACHRTRAWYPAG